MAAILQFRDPGNYSQVLRTIRRLWDESPEGELDDFVENLGLDESRDYVKRVLVLADSYRQLYPGIG